nr:unnamed protein product [Spirometra erinaceieuropaei]
MMHDQRLLCVDDHAEVIAGGREKIHAPLRVSFSSCIEDAVIGEQKFVDGSSGYMRLEVRLSLIEEVAVRPLGDADPGKFVTIGIHQHGSEHEAKEGRREEAAMLYSFGHYECL